jgi:hypothetical protein
VLPFVVNVAMRLSLKLHLMKMSEAPTYESNYILFSKKHNITTEVLNGAEEIS